MQVLQASLEYNAYSHNFQSALPTFYMPNILISFCRQNSILLSILCCFVEWPVKYSPFFKLLPLLSVGEVLDGIQTAEGFLLQTCYSPNHQNLYYQYPIIWNDIVMKRFFFHQLQGVSKKRYFSDFLSYFISRGRILLFHMCFGIRILSLFHLAIQKVSIQNLKCPKNAKNACADMIFIPALRSEDWAGIKIMSAHAVLAFLGHLRFWMDIFWIARWNGLEILIPKHM